MAAPTTAPNAEFQDAGKPVAIPVYQVDTNGAPLSSTDANPVILETVAGTPLLADQGNTELRASIYGKSTTAGDTPIGVDASGRLTAAIQAVLGTALAADQSNTELRVSIYVKTSAAGDTALTVGQTTMANSLPVAIASDEVVPIQRSTVAVYSRASAASSGSTQNSGDLSTGGYTEIALDITTSAQSGTNPTIQYFYERKAADGIYYVLWQSAVLSAASNTLSTSIGAGMAYNQSLGVTGRLRWVVGGSNTPTYTFSANIQGK